MRLAIVSDIHGNLPAFEAVLADLKTQAPDQVYFAGDLVNRCPWTREVIDLYQDLGWPGVKGNHDLILATLNTERSHPIFQSKERFPDMWWTWGRLTKADLALLESLPDELPIRVPGLPSLRMVHGVPGNPFVGIYPEMPPEKIASALASVTDPALVCGHTHRTLDRTVDRPSGRWRIINAGSVGLPYNGDPRAQYAILDGVDGVWRVTFRQVDYDRERVRRAFTTSGMAAEVGPMSELSLRTVMAGEPYASDFSAWLRTQPDEIRINPSASVATYLQTHGPGHWAFFMG